MKRWTAIFCALGLLLLLSACGEQEEGQAEGLFYEASGIHPDADALSVDGRAVPAWRYLYWITDACDALCADGATIDWEARTEGDSLSENIRRQAIRSTAIYATVENWAEKYGVTLSETDQTALAAAWDTKATAYGGEEAYLAALAALGLDRAAAEALSRDYYLYNNLYTLFRTEGSELYASPEELDAFSRESGYYAADWIRIDAASDRAAAQELAAKLFSQLNTGGAESFAALAAQYSQDPERASFPDGRTLRIGAGVLPSEAEAALQTLEVGQCSGIVEAEDSFYLLVRKSPDPETVAGACFDERLRTAAEAADIRLEDRCEKLEVERFYEAVCRLRAEQTPAAQTGSGAADR